MTDETEHDTAQLDALRGFKAKGAAEILGLSYADGCMTGDCDLSVDIIEGEHEALRVSVFMTRDPGPMKEYYPLLQFALDRGKLLSFIAESYAALRASQP